MSTFARTFSIELISDQRSPGKPLVDRHASQLETGGRCNSSGHDRSTQTRLKRRDAGGGIPSAFGLPSAAGI